MPERIRLSRKKGYRKPEGAIVVARPSKWGNPIRIVPVHRRGPFDLERDGVGFIGQCTDLDGARASAVRRFRDLVLNHPGLAPRVDEIRTELAGHDLACWCPLPEPGEPDICHAAVLLELANR
ncbi:DUF4326 domain-containing protein [Gryllotalpicola koreensis]|uniref:DUF4326 domain-containing protein n=1 Tax=Gryllotalpicola koreensis TaxID=993086 RepID=A0ABP8A302_9MICO